ncbi:MAG: cytochrome c [Alphaproteobacteria bacterium]|nr:cytochrome c [Alphaproteobacteria bacterium]
MRQINSTVSRCLIGIFVLSAMALAAESTRANDDAATLDLHQLAAQGRMPASVDIKTENDIVYHKAKHYSGYPLRNLLALIPKLDDLRRGGAEIVFTAEDGYRATMGLDEALAANGVVAFRDLDAPAGKKWVPFTHGKQTITPAPYYLVWPKQDPSNWAYSWPYQLAKIAVQPFSDVFGAAVPKDPNAAVREGFYVFKTYCLQCHSVNLSGGDLAPELNVPRNITEYLQRPVLEAFIHDVPSFRAGSKMPSFKDVLAAKDVTRAVDYLEHMARQKACHDAEACAGMVR